MTEAPANKPRRGAGKVAFLAHLEAFKEMFKAGHGQRTVFDQYESELGISYSQFNRYHAKYIETGATANGHQREGQEQQQKAQPSAAAGRTSNDSGTGSTTPAPPQNAPGTDAGTGKKPARPKVFQHNPNSGNDRDDLI